MASSKAIKIHHTSFTDKQPLYGWKEWHAFRELWQNFRDGLQETYEEEIIYERKADEDGLYYTASLPSTGERVGFVDARNKEKLIISQKGVVLDDRHLQLASSKSKQGKTIGGHGEGFKVGINLLLRKDYQVTYFMSGKIWRFFLRHTCQFEDTTKKEKFRNMVVEEEKGAPREDLYIEIKGSKAQKLFNPLMDLQLVEGLESQVDCPKGSLHHHTDPALYGRVYFRGLYVNSDDNLRRLKLVVNLNMKEQLGRDRHRLPPNTWDHIEKILNNAARKGKQDGVTIFDDLIEIYRNTRKMTKKQAAKTLAYTKEPIRRYVAKCNRKQLEQVLFLSSKKTDEARGRAGLEKELLESLGYVVVSASGALEDEIDVQQIKEEFIRHKTHPIPKDQLSPIEQKNLELWDKVVRTWQLNCPGWKRCKILPKLVVKDLPRGLNLSEPLPDWNLSGTRIVELLIPRSHLSESSCKLRVEVFHMQWGFHLWGESKQECLAQFKTDLFSDPTGYKPKRYQMIHLQEEEKKNVSKSLDFSSGSCSGSVCSSSTRKSTSRGYKGKSRRGKASDDDDDDGEGQIGIPSMMPKLFECTFKGVPLAAGRIPEDQVLTHEDDACRGKHISRLVECTAERGMTLYVESKYKQAWDQDKDSMRSNVLALLSQGIVAVQEQLCHHICAKLGMDGSKLPIVWVVCDRSLMGYADCEGGIYLNLWPLVGSSREDYAQSMYLTILHEMCHRVTSAHNTTFADHLAMLVYQVGPIPKPLATSGPSPQKRRRRNR